MHKSTVLVILSALLLVTFTSLTTIAQDEPVSEVGTKPSGSNSGSAIDNVDLASGNLSVSIPLISYPQRGGRLRLAFRFYYQTGPQTIVERCNMDGETCSYTGSKSSQVSGIDPDNIFSLTGVLNDVIDGEGYETDYPGESIALADGSVHQFVPTTTDARGQGPWRAADASGYLLTADGSGNPVVIDSNGTQFSGIGSTPKNHAEIPPPPTLIKDTNGNEISYGQCTYQGTQVTGWTDTMNRCIPNTLASDTPAAADPYPCPSVSGQPGATSSGIWNLPGVNGGTYSIKECFITFTEQYSYWDPTGGHGQGGDEQESWLTTQMQSLVLPDGTAWTFQYDLTYGTGVLQQITYPTGGSLSYTWTDFGESPAYNACSWQYYNCLGSIVSTRTLNANDGSPSGTWSYNYNYLNGSSPVTVTDAAGNDTDHFFGDYSEGNGLSTYEYSTSYYQGTGGSRSLLKTVNTTYSSQNPFVDPNAVYPLENYGLCVVPSQITTTWADGEESEVQYSYDSASFYYPVYGYPSPGDDYAGSATPWSCTLGKQTQRLDYDYGSGSPGAYLGTTLTSYQFQSDANYLNANLLDPQAYVEVNGAMTSYSYDESNCASGTCGNLTSIHRYINDSTTPTSNCNVSVSGGSVITYMTYNSDGTLASSVDNCGSSPSDASHMTTFAYASPCYAGAGPTSVMNPLGQTTSYCYDGNTGLVTSTTDPNGQVVSTGYDSMLRVLSNTYPRQQMPDGTWITPTASYTYPTANETQISQQIDDQGHSINSTEFVDGLGRPTETELNSDPDGPTYTLTQYDSMGRKSVVYNPTRCSTITTNCLNESTWGDTSYSYDGLSRPQTITEQDGNMVTTNYSSFPCITVTDESGKARQACTDSLGRLTSVLEDPGGLNYSTSYTYDAMNDLTGVTQSGSRQRTFVYDSLSRLISATNPESGTASYSYDANGNLIYKTMPAQNQQGSATATLTYCYDVLNRLTAKAYTQQTCSGNNLASPIASYTYDQSGCQGASSCYNIGSRTGMTDQAGSEAWAYDSVGRALVDYRTTDGFSKAITYTYYADNSVGTESIPQDPTGGHLDLQTFTEGTAGRPISFSDDNYWTIASNLTYTPAGQLCYRWGGYDGTFYTSLTYNNRLQMATIGGVSEGGGDTNPPPSPCAVVNPANYGTNNYDSNTINLVYNYTDLNNHNNGNVASIANNVDPTRSESFTYDNVNRLSSAQTSSIYSTSPQSCWGENYYYDAWGNLTKLAQMQGSYSGCASESGFDFSNGGITAQNQITSAGGYSYDAAGNLIQITGAGGATYAYDAENHLVSTAGETYTYDGDGNRVMKSGPGGDIIYWYGLNPAPLMESDPSSGYSDYVYMYLDGERIARRTYNNIISWYGEDQLGSTAFLQDLGTSHYSDYSPFGAEMAVSNGCKYGCTSVDTNYKFTGKERDSESNLDNFGARFYTSTYGRFMSPDPENAGADPTNPQSWNMYSYALNNPINFVDPDGLQSKCNQAANSYCTSQQNEDFNSDCGVSMDDVCGSGNSEPMPYCTVNGGKMPCGDAESILQSGAGVPCSGSLCDQIRVDANNNLWEWKPAPKFQPTPCPDVSCITVTTYAQGSRWENLSYGGLAAVSGTAGSESGPGDFLVVGGALATLALYKNKDAVKNIIGQIDNAVTHIGFLNNSPDRPPRNHWRNEIRDRISRARTWANRMSPGTRQDIMIRLINAVENAVPED